MQRKVKNLTIHWFSGITKRYNQNAFNKDLGRHKHLYSHFNGKKNSVWQRPLGNSAIKNHEKNSPLKGTYRYIIPLRIFKISKKFHC